MGFSHSSPSMRWRTAPHALAAALLLWLSMAAIAASAAAPEPAGRILRSLGVVEAVAPDGTVRRLRRQDPIYSGDTLRTGPRGRAQLRFTDRGLMSLRPDTELSIDDYEFRESAPAQGRQQLTVTRGGFRAMTGRVASNNRAAYSARTPLGVIGVRGTIWRLGLLAGDMLLGVDDGTIDVTVTVGPNAGSTYGFGEGENFNYVVITSDGEVNGMVEPPSGLDSSPEIDESGDDGEDGGSSGSEEESGGGLGEASDAGDAGAGGESGDALVSVVATATDPNQNAIINPSQTDDGDIATEFSPLQSVLSPEDRAAIIADTRIGIIAGIGTDSVGADGQPLADPGIGLGLTLASQRADGEPLLAGAFGEEALEELLLNTPRDELLAAAQAFLTGASSPPGPIFGGERTFLPAGGEAGVVWGSFSQPSNVFLSDVNRSLFAPTISDNDLLFALGTPSDIATLQGTRFYIPVDSRAASTGGFLVTDIEAETFIDFGTGFVTGILDVKLADEATPGTDLFAYIVDFETQLVGGLLGDANLVAAELIDLQNNLAQLPFDGEISGFLTDSTAGDVGAFVNLAFAYQSPGRSDLNVHGLVLLGISPTPPDALTPAEAALLGAGFGYVESFCCFDGNTFAGLITDPRLTQGQDTIIGGGALDPFDPAFNNFPPAIILRQGELDVVNYREFPTVGTNAELSTFEWQGFTPETSGGIFDSLTGEQITPLIGNVQVLAGRIADIANLTGTATFTLDSLTQGFYVIENGPADVIQAADISFDVDFGTAEITNGFAFLSIGSSDPAAPGGDGPVSPGIGASFLDAQFSGSVALANGNPFASLTVENGFFFDFDQIAGGTGIVDVDNSSLSGFFAGDGDVFNLAFNFITIEDPQAPPGDFLARTNFVGTAILTELDLALQPEEVLQLQEGRVFVAVECCTPFDSGTGFGPAGNPANQGDVLSTGGDFILGLNTDPLGEDLRAGDPGVLDATPEAIARLLRGSGFAELNQFVPPGLELVQGSWTFGDTGENGAILDSATGDLLEALDRTLLFNVAFPSTPGQLQMEALTRPLLTFSGDSSLGSPIIGATTLGGFSDSNITDIDPVFPFQPGSTVSFNVDANTGQVFNGHIFSTAAVFPGPGAPEEFGWELFFEGQLGFANGNTFIDAVLLGGTFDGDTPINLAESSLDFFIAGDSPANGSSFLAQGAFFVQTEPAQNFGGQVVTNAGTFSIGSDLLPETRLSVADASQLNNQRRSVVAVSDITRLGSGLDPVFDAQGVGGVLIGRGSVPTGNDDFFQGANRYQLVQARDPVTSVPLDDGMGNPQLVQANTARRGFFSQPFDFIVRQGTDPLNQAMELDFTADAVPTGGMSLPGFEVAWGRWDSSGSTDSAIIQFDPENGLNTVVLDRNLFFASVQPTPQSQMPTMGSFSYVSGGLNGIGDNLGSGLGAIGGGAGQNLPLDFLTAAFDLDFSTGLVSNGSIELAYQFSGTESRWTGSFDGFVNGAVADLQLQSLLLETFLGGSPLTTEIGDLTRSEIGGVFTGPAAERFVGGFNFVAEDSLLPGAFEGVSGVFILDQATLGTPPPMAPAP